MPNWVIKDAGAGGAASPTQVWDLDSGVVTVHPPGEPLLPEGDDFELLRASRDAAGRPFPGEFAFSPIDGAPLTPPPAWPTISVNEGGLPTSSAAGGPVFGKDFQLETIPASDAVHAGEPALGLACDLFKGKVFRWSPKGGSWRVLADVPASEASKPRRRPLTVRNGFVYAGLREAVAVVRPGPERWQEVIRSSGAAKPVAAAIRQPDGAAVLAQTETGAARLLLWSVGGSEWREKVIQGDVCNGDAPFSPGITLPDGAMVWSRPEHLVRVKPAGDAAAWKWPDAFEPNLDVAPIPGEDEFYQLGESEGAPAWARVTPEGDRSISPAVAPVSVLETLLVTPGGIGGGSEAVASVRLPEGFGGKPLARFADGVLLLLIEHDGAWADALALKPKRWPVRLVWAPDGGDVQDLWMKGEPSTARRCGKVSQVEVLLCDGMVAVLGLDGRKALVWRQGETV